ncbi:MAG: DNA-binding protein WhiA, partial [Clostridiales bacterium]|nr:DNA-binding protein WhiA [Clostridiales bacterium]
MSFSSDVKDELELQVNPARHCMIAELAAIVSMCGNVKITANNKITLKITTENIVVARKSFTLIEKTFNISTDIIIRSNSGNTNKVYNIIVTDNDMALKILQATKLISNDLEIREDFSLASNLVIRNTCCKRAFIRGAFLVAGSISNPEKDYHFEIVVPFAKKAVQLQEIINTFGLEAKIVRRKKNFVIYLKESSQIVDILNIMEAHVALMKLENIRIYKDMRNSINRQVNCETANIEKTVKAATKQIEDIYYIRNSHGFSELSDGLEEIAILRVKHPDASLKELGEMLDPPLSKSGV